MSFAGRATFVFRLRHCKQAELVSCPLRVLLCRIELVALAIVMSPSIDVFLSRSRIQDCDGLKSCMKRGSSRPWLIEVIIVRDADAL